MLSGDEFRSLVHGVTPRTISNWIDRGCRTSGVATSRDSGGKMSSRRRSRNLRTSSVLRAAGRQAMSDESKKSPADLKAELLERFDRLLPRLERVVDEMECRLSPSGGVRRATRTTSEPKKKR